MPEKLKIQEFFSGYWQAEVIQLQCGPRIAIGMKEGDSVDAWHLSEQFPGSTWSQGNPLGLSTKQERSVCSLTRQEAEAWVLNRTIPESYKGLQFYPARIIDLMLGRNAYARGKELREPATIQGGSREQVIQCLKEYKPISLEDQDRLYKVFIGGQPKLESSVLLSLEPCPLYTDGKSFIVLSKVTMNYKGQEVPKEAIYCDDSSQIQKVSGLAPDQWEMSECGKFLHVGQLDSEGFRVDGAYQVWVPWAPTPD